MGEIPRTVDRSSPIRRLARLVEPIHTVCYYAPEIRRFTEHGFRGWWHSYFAYRSAPMGEVSAAAVTAVFYNFAPRMVERAVPNCWDVMSAEDVRTTQVILTGEALARCLGGPDDDAADGAVTDEIADEIAGAVTDAAATLRAFAADLPVAARPLYAAWAAQDWPGDGVADDALTLWHGCTLLREFRFDGHNIALAANGLDPCECHVMMATHGHGDAATIERIRGWTPEEWDAACDRLRARGWLDSDGSQTPAGAAGRSQVEADTDEMAAAAAAALDEAGAESLLGRLEVVAKHLVDSGEVSGVWPPPHVLVKG